MSALSPRKTMWKKLAFLSRKIICVRLPNKGRSITFLGPIVEEEAKKLDIQMCRKPTYTKRIIISAKLPQPRDSLDANFFAISSERMMKKTKHIFEVEWIR